MSRTPTFATLSDEPQLTDAQIEYLSDQLIVALPTLMAGLEPIISKESVKARDVNAHEVVSATSNAKTSDAANIDALQAKIDLDRTLLEWDVRVARYCPAPVMSNGKIISYKPAGREPFKQAINIAKHLNEYLDFLACYDFLGKNAIDFFNEVVRSIRRVRKMLGVHGEESAGVPTLIIGRNAAQVARDSGLDQPLSPPEIVRAMNKAGYHDLKTDNIRKWAARGHLTPMGVRNGKSNLYLISDVMEIYKRSGKVIQKDVA